MRQERKKLQPWVSSLGRHPTVLVWKVQDEYVLGIPDMLLKHRPSGHVMWLELKWVDRLLVRDGCFRTGLTAEQYVHLHDWGEGAYLLIAVEPAGRVYLIPAAVLPTPTEKVTPEDLSRRSGVTSCGIDAGSVRQLVGSALTSAS